jgi:hypothetical protein
VRPALFVAEIAANRRAFFAAKTESLDARIRAPN